DAAPRKLMPQPRRLLAMREGAELYPIALAHARRRSARDGLRRRSRAAVQQRTELERLASALSRRFRRAMVEQRRAHTHERPAIRRMGLRDDSVESLIGQRLLQALGGARAGKDAVLHPILTRCRRGFTGR